MILEVRIGEHVTVTFDDELTDNPPSPELVEDYLNRMGRTASNIWDGTTNDIQAPALIDPDVEPGP